MTIIRVVIAVILACTQWTNAAQTRYYSFTGFGHNQTDTYRHFPVADVGNVQEPVQYSFVDQSPLSFCNYFLCARGLSQPPEDLSQWTKNCGRNLVNVTSATQQGNFYLPIGRVTFSVLSRPSELSATDCQFTLNVTVTQCDQPGTYGPTCQTPIIPTPLNNATNFNIPISNIPPFPVITASPTSRGSAAIEVNVTLRASDGSIIPGMGVTLLERDGNVPIYDQYNPICDTNVTSSGDYNAAVINITAPSERHMTSRENPPPRYFMLAQPNGTVPAGAQLLVSTREYNCTAPYIGSICASIPPALSLPGPLLTITGTQFTTFQAWTFFAVFVSEQYQNDFSIGVSVPDGYIAPDMYLRLGGLPTTSLYDVIVQSTPTREAMSTVFYESGETNVDGRPPWYLGLNYPQGYVDGGVNMQLLIFNGEDCPNSCSQRGSCQNHRCVCNDGWAGVQCEIEVIEGLLSPLARVLLPLFSILGAVAIAVLMCMHFRKTTDSTYHMATLRGSGILGMMGARQYSAMPASAPAAVDPPRRGGLSGPPPAARPSRAPGTGGVGPRGNIHGL